MIKLALPTTEDEIRKLKVGDEVLLSGVIVTARDTAHKYMVEKRPDDIRDMLNGTVIYHCGPVMKQDDDGSWEVVAAGPTTSIREEIYQADVMEEYKVRGVIGKGGMGPKTLAGLKKTGAVYFHAIGGASQVLARAVVRVPGVQKLEEFGVPEAFWRFEVKDFPVVVTMDSHGESLHDVIGAASEEKMKEILGSM
ncbi:Fumarate hydratase class I, beta region; L(+)-tartrate dehydratase beta subunit [hydrothermal vent metagenome]|uniref:Fumarate hydratase class I, beta region L(+)-tartrate dehydratase beta subunit n=1 Tax=hydrothermal vent metagenome TaxID=652676 RepID=A0A3B1BDK0_9ZZZZ